MVAPSFSGRAHGSSVTAILATPSTGPGLWNRSCASSAVARGFGIARTMVVTAHDEVEKLAAFLFKEPGPCLAVAKIALSEDPWRLPEKDGAIIAHRFRTALGVESA